MVAEHSKLLPNCAVQYSPDFGFWRVCTVVSEQLGGLGGGARWLGNVKVEAYII